MTQMAQMALDRVLAKASPAATTGPLDPLDNEPTRRYRIARQDDAGGDAPTLELELTAVNAEPATAVERPIRGRPINRRRRRDTIPDGIYYAQSNRAA